MAAGRKAAQVSGGGEGPNLPAIIERVVGERLAGVDPEDMETTWEVGVHLEGAVFDAVWDNLPRGYSRVLIEQVLGLVDWARVVEKATWAAAEREDTIL